MEQDFLDEMIEESTKRNPEFPALMEEARQRRALLDDLVAIRNRSRISQESRHRDRAQGNPDANPADRRERRR